MAAARVLGRTILTRTEAAALTLAATKVLSSCNKIHPGSDELDKSKSQAQIQIRSSAADVLLSLCGTPSAALYVFSPVSLHICSARACDRLRGLHSPTTRAALDLSSWSEPSVSCNCQQVYSFACGPEDEALLMRQASALAASPVGLSSLVNHGEVISMAMKV